MSESLRLLKAILEQLDRPDSEIDYVWADEARKRWAAYKAGKIPTVSYEDNGKTPLMIEIRFLTLAQREVDDAVVRREKSEA